MIRQLKFLSGLLLAAALAACGGGGGSPGGNPNGGTGGGGSNGGTNPNGLMTLQLRNAANAETSQISATETGHATVTVKNANGGAVSGAIVAFSQADASLITFAPESGTALTDSNGQATVDFKATDPSRTGAVSIVATAVVGTQTLTAKAGVQITGTVATTEVPRSILFLDASPTSIVIKGAGGQGRSESSTLRFKVVNASNTPIRGAVVNFSVSTPNVSLNIPSATSDAEGVVVTTVTSGTQPASVVVTATAAANSAATVPSSALSVSNGLTMAGGLEVVAKEYNIDGGVTGTTTEVSAFMRDVNGNLVPDGTIASFTTDFGAVGTSSAGSCASVDGACKVQFRVQDPRGDGLATVRATVQLPGNPNPLTDAIQINMASSGGARALSALPSTQALALNLGSVCKDTFTLYAADSKFRAVAARTTISAEAAGKGATVGVDAGSPVPDSLDNFTPTSFRVTVTVPTTAPASCVDGGKAGGNSTDFLLKFTSPGGVISSVPIRIFYPSTP